MFPNDITCMLQREFSILVDPNMETYTQEGMGGYMDIPLDWVLYVKNKLFPHAEPKCFECEIHNCLIMRSNQDCGPGAKEETVKPEDLAVIRVKAVANDIFSTSVGTLEEYLEFKKWYHALVDKGFVKGEISKSGLKALVTWGSDLMRKKEEFFCLK